MWQLSQLYCRIILDGVKQRQMIDSLLFSIVVLSSEKLTQKKKIVDVTKYRNLSGIQFCTIPIRVLQKKTIPCFFPKRSCD